MFCDGKAVRLSGAFQDITCERGLGEDLLRAKETAEAASQSKSAFLAAMSHEIRTPMHTVLGYTDLLKDSQLDDEQRECVDIISSSGNSLLRLIDDILDFSKVEAGKMRLALHVFEIHGVVRDVVRMLQPQAGGKGLQVSIESDAPTELEAFADSQRVHQVLVNLIGNAVKFTPSGEVVIAVAHQDDVVRVQVRDTGIGIPSDQLPRLFEDFVQIDSSRQRDFGGTGLGLAISKRLIELMGGEIGAESEHGIGSTFWFTLPLAPAGGERAQCEQAVHDAAEAQALRDTRDHGPFRVLLAEDNRLNQRLAVRALETFGYTVETANDGVQAFSMACEGIYDLILMDCLMPGMDGLETARRIREQEQATGEHVPIIALTANALPEDRDACLESGMDDFVSKPFTKQALRTATERWLLQVVD